MSIEQKIKALPDNSNVEAYPANYDSDDVLASFKGKDLKALVAKAEQTAELRDEVERLKVGLIAAVDVLALIEDVYCGGRDVPNLEAQVDELKRRLIRLIRQGDESETIILDSTDGGGE